MNGVSQLYFDVNDETPLVRELYTDDGLTTPKTAKLDNEDLPIVISFDNTKAVDTTYYPVEVISDGEYYGVTSEGKAVYAQLSNSSTGALYTIKDGVKTSLGISLVGEDLLTPIINWLHNDNYYYSNGKVYLDETLETPLTATLAGNQVQVELSSDYTVTIGLNTYLPFQIDGTPVQTNDGAIPVIAGWGDFSSMVSTDIYYKSLEYPDEPVYSAQTLYNKDYTPPPLDDDIDSDADSDDDG